jgi:O-antigen ligase
VVVASQLILGTTVYRHATEAGASLYFCYGLLAFLVTQALRRSSQVKRVAAVLTAYGAAVAIFALVQSLSSDGKLYWVREPQGGGAIYGPYVNRNHYAGLMEMLIPVAIAAVLSNHVRRKWRPWFACAAVLMAGTIFLSGSRGGMLAFLVQMALLGLVLGINRNRRAAWITASILAAILGLALWVGGQPMVARVLSIHGEAQAELDGGLRLRVDRDSLKMFGRKPVLGWGLGSFGEVYPTFRSFATDKIIDQAHNDYVQLLVETGVLGFATGAWFIILVFRRGIGKLSNWAWDMNGTVALAALLASAGILVHGWVDFNLQIPANAALFYTLCAVAAAPTRFGSQRAHPPLSRRA